MKRFALHALLGFALAASAAAVAYDSGAPPGQYDNPFVAATADADLSMLFGRTPLQPWHWGSHYDPTQIGEGLNLEVIDNGPGSNLNVVGYVYVHLRRADEAPVWLFFNAPAQTAFRDHHATPFYRFNLYRVRPDGAPPDDPPGWIDIHVQADGRLLAEIVGRTQQGDSTTGVRRFWVLDQLSRPPGVGEMVRCNPPPTFSPPAPQHRFCRDNTPPPEA